MRRILVATTPGEGHVNGMVEVARALVQAGHTVRWYTGRAFRGKVESTGAEYVPMRHGLDWGGKTREEAFPHHAGLTGVASMTAAFRDIFFRPAYGQMIDILAVLDEYPADVIVTGETIFGACFAAERRGVPIAWVATSIYIFGSRDTAPLGLGLPPSSSPAGRLRNRVLKVASRNLLGPLRELRREADVTRSRAGLRPIPKGPFENIVDPPDLYLMGTVPSFEYPRSDMLPQTHFVGPFVGPPPQGFDKPAWWGELDGGRPVVHVTQGTVANDADRLLVPALRALGDMDVLVVATTGVPPESLGLGPLPANVRLERFVPHFELLPHVDVMVTNGGYGGVNTALSHGVPLVVAPASEEKHEVAARVSWSGVGIGLRRQALTAAGLRSAVDTVLTEPSYRRRAQTVREEYRRHDGPRQAVRLIERLALTDGRFSGDG
ncbi:glycosyltransferase [Sphaerisporangium rubeum]|uniref:MGT family glycosyltransferase n=1 Tax=Sphaerisporangium rubeum TaxID=321317 RepID=A0A7X0M5N8_9ACTN|nr:glycosyltransferase [Sphaerisporangium rubeum]MBB6471021.1 MGT family glycosyltransferase [Sphaerisporangium rubeum]